jgi:hypothetical protein
MDERVYDSVISEYATLYQCRHYPSPLCSPNTYLFGSSPSAAPSTVAWAAYAFFRPDNTVLPGLNVAPGGYRIVPGKFDVACTEAYLKVKRRKRGTAGEGYIVLVSIEHTVCVSVYQCSVYSCSGMID